MPKFRYRMQNILDVKEKIESQEKIAFGIAMAAFQEEQDALQKLLVSRAGYERRLKEMQEGGTLDLREIQSCKSAIENLKYRIKDQMLKVRKAQNNVNVARIRLDNATKERKTHENLKEKAFEAYKMELNAEEMKQIDQLVSYTYGRKATDQSAED